MLKIKEIMSTKNEEIPSPYDIFCIQECEKMNQLLEDISTSLEDLYLGLEGALNMTDKMEQLALSLSLNRVPFEWGKYFPSKKNLSSWYK